MPAAVPLIMSSLAILDSSPLFASGFAVRARVLAVLAVCLGCVFAVPDLRSQSPAPAAVLLDDQTIIGVFEDLLGREPSRRELREWRARSEGMSPEDLEVEIRHTREFRNLTPEQAITAAYRDLLGRAPDPEGMRHYRRRMVDRGWTAGAVRNAIRASDEFRIRQSDLIIERAFDDLLEREPTKAEREEYRRHLSKDGTEEAIRRRIRGSEEFNYTIPRAKITQAYQEILGRDPEPAGLEHYRKRMIKEGWSIERVRGALLKSPEYRDKHRKP